MYVWKYCCFFDNFLIRETPKNMTKTIHETSKFPSWFFTNDLKLVNSIPANSVIIGKIAFLQILTKQNIEVVEKRNPVPFYAFSQSVLCVFIGHAVLEKSLSYNLRQAFRSFLFKIGSRESTLGSGEYKKAEYSGDIQKGNWRC